MSSRNGGTNSMKASREDVRAIVLLLRQFGPMLKYPHSSGIKGSKHPHLRGLRIQHAGPPLRVLYAFDLRRMGVLLIGGNKTGADRWYEPFVPLSDKIYDEHLVTLKREGLLDG